MVLPTLSVVVACKTGQGSPGDGASALAIPSAMTNAIGAIRAVTGMRTNRQVFIDQCPGFPDET